MPRTVVHLIPHDGVGGVERAARTVPDVDAGDIRFRVRHVVAADGATTSILRFHPNHYVACLWRIVRAPPDMLIVSLWKACLIGIPAKLLRPKIRLVLFLHYARPIHLADALTARIAAWLATEIWADSQTTLAARSPALASRPARVISFVTERIAALAERPPRPVLAFWGRLHPSKCLDRALRLFAMLHARRPDARFIVIGPDLGALAELRRLAERLGIADAVAFHDAMPFEQVTRAVRDASFFLHTSRFEGMAMSVVESMVLGLVPVVTPAGEIARYCRDGENALIVEDDAGTVERIVALLDDPADYHRMRSAAVASFGEAPLYRDSILAACREALAP